MGEKMEFTGGEHFWTSFIQAMWDGAPCARTLRTLYIDATFNEEQMAVLQTVLPQVKRSSVKILFPDLHLKYYSKR